MKPCSKGHLEGRYVDGRCKACRRASRRLWYQRTYSQSPGFQEKRSEESRLSVLALKKEVLAHYGNGILACACCGEDEFTFLQLDHVNNDGAHHRKRLAEQGFSGPFYRILKRAGFPTDYELQVLCSNCNYAKRFGICPHQK